jgi:hypothetical protein
LDGLIEAHGGFGEVLLTSEDVAMSYPVPDPRAKRTE